MADSFGCNLTVEATCEFAGLMSTPYSGVPELRRKCDGGCSIQYARSGTIP
jgi:hypothetical protein